MNKRYFTVEEANEMVPFLTDAFTRIVQMRLQIADIYQLLELADAAPESENFTIALEDASPGIIHNRATLRALSDQVRQEVADIQITGCMVKGIDQGLVDWYAQRGNTDVLLCWRLGESDVQWWHGAREGVRGRRPIDEFYDLGEPSETTKSA